MYAVSYLWQGSTLPDEAAAVWAGDLARLDELAASGWDPDAPILLAKNTSARPITIALSSGSRSAVEWLIGRDVALDAKEEPAFLTAVRIADITLARRVAEAGADVHAAFRVGGDAYQQALMDGRSDVLAHLELIADFGHDPAAHGGPAFRHAVGDRRLDVAEWFLDRGVDVDFRGFSQVWPWSPTALGVVARYGALETARWLVERGADVATVDLDGLRPYTVAVERGDGDLVAYFRSLEPEDVHARSNAVSLLRAYKAPAVLTEFLSAGSRRVTLPRSGFEWIDIFALEDVVALNVGRSKVLRLSRASGEYPDIQLVWISRSKKVGWWDVEHRKLGVLASWADFIADPDRWMATIFV